MEKIKHSQAADDLEEVAQTLLDMITVYCLEYTDQEYDELCHTHRQLLFQAARIREGRFI